MLAGPVSDAIGIPETLVVAAAWTVLSTFVLLSLDAVRGVRRTRRKPALEAATALR
jgi:hypothetical protein